MVNPSTLKKAIGAAKALLIEAALTSATLFKIIIPVSIIAKVLDEVGATSVLGEFLSPLMSVVGLPGSMGLVWATALITNIYGGLVIFASVAPAQDLTVAQITVLTTMILVAHAFPVELSIAKQTGVRVGAVLPLRIGAALAMGFLLHHLYSLTEYLDEPSDALWSPTIPDPAWIPWAKDTALNLLALFAIILLLLFLLKILKKVGITSILERILAPLLRTLGIGKAAIPITVVGMTLGISYGGGLIIREVKTGRISGRDVFFSFALMSICHSLIEDTLLMTLMGGHISGTLFFRVAFSLAAIFGLHRLSRSISGRQFERFFYRKPKDARAEETDQ